MLVSICSSDLRYNEIRTDYVVRDSRQQCSESIGWTSIGIEELVGVCSEVGGRHGWALSRGDDEQV